MNRIEVEANRQPIRREDSRRGKFGETGGGEGRRRFGVGRAPADDGRAILAQGGVDQAQVEQDGAARRVQVAGPLQARQRLKRSRNTPIKG